MDHSLCKSLREGLTSRINPRALLHLSKLPTVALYLATKLVYRPLNQIGNGTIARHLFYNEYMKAIADLAGASNTRLSSII